MASIAKDAITINLCLYVGTLNHPPHPLTVLLTKYGIFKCTHLYTKGHCYKSNASNPVKPYFVPFAHYAVENLEDSYYLTKTKTLLSFSFLFFSNGS